MFDILRDHVVICTCKILERGVFLDLCAREVEPAREDTEEKQETVTRGRWNIVGIVEWENDYSTVWSQVYLTGLWLKYIIWVNTDEMVIKIIERESLRG